MGRVSWVIGMWYQTRMADKVFMICLSQ